MEQQKLSKPKEAIQCFECEGRGHSSELSQECILLQVRLKVRREPQHNQDMTQVGRIKGTFVSDILLVTGCDQTLVCKELVPDERIVTGEVPIRCAHRDIHKDSGFSVAAVDIKR